MSSHLVSIRGYHESCSSFVMKHFYFILFDEECDAIVVFPSVVDMIEKLRIICDGIFRVAA